MCIRLNLVSYHIYRSLHVKFTKHHPPIVFKHQLSIADIPDLSRASDRWSSRRDNLSAGPTTPSVSERCEPAEEWSRWRRRRYMRTRHPPIRRPANPKQPDDSRKLNEPSRTRDCVNCFLKRTHINLNMRVWISNVLLDNSRIRRSDTCPLAFNYMGEAFCFCARCNSQRIYRPVRYRCILLTFPLVCVVMVQAFANNVRLFLADNSHLTKRKTIVVIYAVNC